MSGLALCAPLGLAVVAGQEALLDAGWSVWRDGRRLIPYAE